MSYENHIAIDPQDDGSVPYVEVRGDQDNINIGMRSKGFNGQVLIDTNAFRHRNTAGEIAFSVDTAPGTANYVGISAAGAGSSPAHKVLGTDTDINYDLYPKGQGRGRINSESGLENIPTVVASVNTTNLDANVSSTALYNPPDWRDGMYRISAYVVLTGVATVSSTLPNVQISYVDFDSAQVVTLDVTPVLAGAGLGQTGTLAGNVEGLVASGVVVINVDAAGNINYQTVNYASVSANEMLYALHIICEKL